MYTVGELSRINRYISALGGRCKLDECCDMDCDCEEGCACGCDDCEDEIIEVECPECGETVCFYDEMMDDEGEYDTVEILCPKCDAVVYTFESELIEDIDDEDIAF